MGNYLTEANCLVGLPRVTLPVLCERIQRVKPFQFPCHP